MTTVGTPTESVAEAELLLVDPVRGAVDDVLANIIGESDDGEVFEILDEDVLLAEIDPGDPGAVGRELGEHH